MIQHLNSVLLEGVIVDDPRLIQLADPAGSAKLVKFDVASDRFYMDKEGNKAVETVFIPVQCWGTLGEKCLEKLSKGMRCRTVGRLRLCRWKGADGSSRRSIEIVAQHLEFRLPKGREQKSAMEILEGKEGESDSTAGECEVLYTFA